MTLRRGIVLTAFVPVMALIGLWLSFRFYWPVPPGKYEYSSSEFTVLGEDGTVLPGLTLYSSTRESRGIVIMVPDSGLDRDWNAKGAAFRTGGLIARTLAGNGLDVVRYDQRGTGKSEVSGRFYPNLERGVDDLSLVVGNRRKDKPEAPVILIGHGSGCNVVLRASLRLRPAPQRVILFSCGFAGSLLEHWGERVFGNMEELRVEPDLVRSARAVWREYLNAAQSGRTPSLSPAPARYAKHPDWLGFEAAVKSLATPERKDWALEAPRVRFKDDLEAALRITKVAHYLAEFEEEIPMREREALLRMTRSISPRAYSFQILTGTGHFLKAQERAGSGPVDRLVIRSGPFRKLAPSVIEVLQKTE